MERNVLSGDWRKYTHCGNVANHRRSFWFNAYEEIPNAPQAVCKGKMKASPRYSVYINFILHSDNDFYSDCRIVNKCHQQQSSSGLLSPGRNNQANG